MGGRETTCCAKLHAQSNVVEDKGACTAITRVRHNGTVAVLITATKPGYQTGMGIPTPTCVGRQPAVHACTAELFALISSRCRAMFCRGVVRGSSCPSPACLSTHELWEFRKSLDSTVNGLYSKTWQPRWRRRGRAVWPRCGRSTDGALKEKSTYFILQNW